MNRLDKIEARANAATKGPWAPWKDQDGAKHMQGLLMVGNADAVIPEGELWVEDVDINPIAHTYTPEDREFIAHARTDVPWLLEQVKLRDKALEAVLEMHELAQPITAAFGTQEGGDYCRTCVEDWPCPTVETIRRHLGDDL